MQKNSVFDTAHFLLITTVLLSLFCCFTLIRSNRKFSKEIAQIDENYLDRLCLRVGDWVPNAQAINSQGKQQEIRAQKESACLIQVVSQRCAASGVQIAQWWPQLASDSRLTRVNPTLISVEGGLNSELYSEELNGRVLFAPGPSFRRAFKVYQLPLLALITPEGVVTWLHRGVLDQAVYDDLVRAAAPFSRVLPGTSG